MSAATADRPDGTGSALPAGLTAVVTGASSGIGAAITEAFARAGANVLLVGRDQARLKMVAAAAAGTGASTETLVADVRDEGYADAIVERTLDRFGSIDVLIPCAGIYAGGAIEELPMEMFDQQLDVNLRAPYALVRAAVPHMARGSSIIFVSSHAGRVGFPQSAAYCATKGAIEQLTRALALELAPRDICVNAVAPGIILTAINRADIEGSAEYRQSLLDRIPAARIGSVDDVAPAVVFLASRGARYIHGVSLTIDGGWTAQ